MNDSATETQNSNQPVDPLERRKQDKITREKQWEEYLAQRKRMTALRMS